MVSCTNTGIRAILLIGLLSFSVTVKAQFIKGAVIGGVNLSQVDGDEVYGFKKFGANVGAAAIIPFTDHWEVSIETIFSKKGSHQRPQREDSLTGE
ncbi:MAG: hypothetical protein PHD25_07755, partial [Bacteroidales bacterium]|nr:hypothetical protein [Bacteroidales bacterium]